MRFSKGYDMRYFMRRILPLSAAAVLLLGAAARADQPAVPANPNNGGLTVGVGMICNTADQAEHFITLRANGAAPEQAMAAVNKEAQDARACGIAAIAYTLDHTMNLQSVSNQLVQVVRINVLAGYNGSGWQRMPNMVQYAVIEGGGESI